MTSTISWYLVSIITGMSIGPLYPHECMQAADSARAAGVVCKHAVALQLCPVPDHPEAFTSCPVFDIPQITVKP